ncbi:MAG: hypothetical protein EOO52_05705 [Gammaproteobacteria bacterium]|nr:MAG: hypothetical protein EOO52_05705 [Gammaproteobacteria bacterium]
MKRKDTRLTPISFALQEIDVVPMRHPCCNITKTNFLFVCQRFSSSARGARMGWRVKAKSKSWIPAARE